MNLLLCEDDSSIGHLLQRGLRREGFTVDWVQRGRQGLEMALSRHYDSVILDLTLPDVDGLTVCRELRDGNNSVPLLMLTARDTLDQKVAGFEAGADDYLTKPFAFEELIVRIRALSRRAQGVQHPGEILQAGDIRLDRAAMTVWCDDRPVELTEREFQLLVCLMEQADKVVPRQRIIHRVWGLGAEISDNAVDVYVGYLRRKLDEHCQRKRIRTVRGVGFRFETCLPEKNPKRLKPARTRRP